MTSQTSFHSLSLDYALIETLESLGYSTPTPIQQQTIPFLLQGKDVLGQAQTGTGKTAAFALPLLSQVQLDVHKPQILVLAPTRELAMQVADSFKKYGKNMKGLKVTSICGGQKYHTQLQALSKGAHIVVGTPGRIMDHMRRGTLCLDHIKGRVLDEADEMLRMGFIDDVEWILEHTPNEVQTALFSATMPRQIRHIAKTYLQDASEVTIKSTESKSKDIDQRLIYMHPNEKLNALCNLLEVEDVNCAIVFVRTKQATLDITQSLKEHGHRVRALNGDISQNLREETIQKIKNGRINLIVATDVAARGLDIENLTHVFNYDIPFDAETYVHRIGRTGRAGRKGKAILFVASHERHLLRKIERLTQQKVRSQSMPTIDEINQKRIARFKQSIADALEQEGLELFYQVIKEFQKDENIHALDIAAALALKAQGNRPLLLTKAKKQASHDAPRKPHHKAKRRDRDRPFKDRDNNGKRPFSKKKSSFTKSKPKKAKRALSSARPQ